MAIIIIREILIISKILEDQRRRVLCILRTPLVIIGYSRITVSILSRIGKTLLMAIIVLKEKIHKCKNLKLLRIPR